ncbi:unnamed protein product [Effrenium voratum]|nr:unnamed protein product [Effrenium voratum]CAJ1428663.1 unnamed protein product [Effrenium voratum]
MRLRGHVSGQSAEERQARRLNDQLAEASDVLDFCWRRQAQLRPLHRATALHRLAKADTGREWMSSARGAWLLNEVTADMSH